MECSINENQTQNEALLATIKKLGEQFGIADIANTNPKDVKVLNSINIILAAVTALRDNFTNNSGVKSEYTNADI